MTMLQATSVGDPADVVELIEQPDALPAAGEALVALEAATINDSDFLLIEGQYAIRPALPAALGAEGAGRIVEVGPAGDPRLVGRRVAILPTYEQGTWADRVVTRLDNLVLAEDDVDPQQLAMVGINPMTAFLLIRYTEPSPGDWVGQTGGNSAVGRYVVQLAKAEGLKTLSVVRRPEVAEELLGLGADLVVVDGDNLAADLGDALAGRRLAAAFDPIGGPAITELAHHMRYGAPVISYAVLSGQLPTIEPQDLVFGDVSLHGLWVIQWLRHSPRDEVLARYAELASLVARGELSAPVDRTFALGDYREAFRHAKSQGRAGKVLFTFGDQP
jgi:trans-2-enoyl-CoA reductase